MRRRWRDLIPSVVKANGAWVSVPLVEERDFRRFRNSLSQCRTAGPFETRSACNVLYVRLKRISSERH